ncbi:MAG: YgjP-like metallopeptidase domain-containing protein, partial [Patescibacteria group bacterium]
MKAEIVTIGKEVISYTLKQRRYQRQINFIVHQDGTLVVTAPKMCRKKTIEKEIIKHSDWIKKQIGDKNNN